MLYTGEEQAIRRVVEAGAAYGYGNMIDRLKIAWMLKLKDDPRCSWEAACLGAGLDKDRTKQIVKAVKKDEVGLLCELKNYICFAAS